MSDFDNYRNKLFKKYSVSTSKQVPAQRVSRKSTGNSKYDEYRDDLFSKYGIRDEHTPHAPREREKSAEEYRNSAKLYKRKRDNAVNDEIDSKYGENYRNAIMQNPAAAAGMYSGAFSKRYKERDDAETKYYQALDKLYYAENPKKLESVKSDERTSSDWSSAQTIDSDMKRIRNIMSTQKHGLAGVDDAMRGDRDYIQQKYGVNVGSMRNAQKLLDDLEQERGYYSNKLKAEGYNYDRMADFQERQERAERREGEAETNRNLTKKIPIISDLTGYESKVVAPIVSSAMALGGYMVKPLDQISLGKQMYDNWRRGDEDYRPLDTTRMEASTFADDIVQENSRRLEETFPMRIGGHTVTNADGSQTQVGGVNLASFLYQTGMSIGNSALNVGLMGPASLGWMGAQAATDEAKELAEKGASPMQIVLGALASGTAESFFERFSVKGLLKFFDVGKDAGRKAVMSTVKDVFKQMGTEASEEIATEITNIISDAVIMRGNSEYNQLVNELMQNGLSEEDAEKEAIYSNISQVVWAGVGGALSGGVMGSVGNYYNNKQYHKIYGKSQQELVQEAKELNPEDKFVQKMDKKVQDGKNLTGDEVRQLVELNDLTIDEGEETSEEPQDYVTNPFNEEEEESGLLEEDKLEQPSPAAQVDSDKEIIRKASAKYGKRSGIMEEAYEKGVDQDASDFATAYDYAFNVGSMMGDDPSGKDYVNKAKETQVLNEQQRMMAYIAGKDAADSYTKASGKQTITGNTPGTVKSVGVKMPELRKQFNDTQRKAYKIMSNIASATGVNVVLYKSDLTADQREDYGKFDWDTDTIYVDVNAGVLSEADANDLGKYTMLRTFTHEFTHFMEKNASDEYRRLRLLVLEEMENHGEDVNELIQLKMAQYGDITYEEAARELVAESMADILNDSKFAENLQKQNPSLFDRILEALKEFVADLKAYFKSINYNMSREVNAVREEIGDTIKYLDSVIDMWDSVAEEAVKNYQKRIDYKNPVKIIKRSAKTEETVAKSEENEQSSVQQTEESEKETEIQDEHFTIYDNADYDSIEIKFDGKPSEEVRNVLKANKFRWHKKKQVWYGKADKADIAEKLRAAYGEEQAEEIEQATDKVEQEIEQEIEQPAAEEVVESPEAVEETAEEPAAEETVEEPSPTETVEEPATVKEESEKPAAETVDQPKYVAFTPSIIKLFDESTKLSTVEIDGKYYVAKGLRVFEVPQEGYDVVNKKYADKIDNSKWYSLEIIIQDVFLNEGNKELNITEAPREAYIGLDGFNVYEYAYGRSKIYFPKSEFDIIKDGEISIFRSVDKKLRYFAKSVMDNGITAYLFDVTLTKFNKDNYRYVDEAVEESSPVETVEEPVVEETVEEEPASEEVVEEPASETVETAEVADISDSLMDKVNEAIRKSKLDGYKDNQAKQNKIKRAIYEVVQDEELTENLFNDFMEGKLGEEVKESEVISNEETVDQTDSENRSDGAGASRLLEERETADVPGTAEKEETVEHSAERGTETGRSGDLTDAAGDVGGRSEGSSESTDLRRDDGLTEEQAEKAAEKLHEEVQEEIEQKSTVEPRGKNFVISKPLDIPSGNKAKYKANVEAIRTLKKLEEENRFATPKEQEVLSKYIGWGGLSEAFNSRKTEWSSEYEELKSLLTKEEYESASRSTLSSFFTDIPVIKAMYGGLKSLGFKGGRMLEPSSGVGNFVGAMPAAMSKQVKSWTMVELDSITGRIAKYLYPNADVRIEGFQDSNIPDNFMDVIIGNVPFGNINIFDKKYPKAITSRIHNYFFAKALDKTRPGGILMLITSSGTMDSKGTDIRQYIMDRANLLGAIRLPNTAFKGNANTEVVSDILVLQKRNPGTKYSGQPFLTAEQHSTYSRNVHTFVDYATNEYYAEHPEMVLGEMVETSGQRGAKMTYNPKPGDLGEQIEAAFENIKGQMLYPSKPTPEKASARAQVKDSKVKKNGLVVKDGKVFRNKDGVLVEEKETPRNVKKIEGMLSIRDALKELQYSMQQGRTEDSKKARKLLNERYDDFYSQYGPLNMAENKNRLDSDPDKFSLLALEKNFDRKTKSAEKMDIFFTDTIKPDVTEFHADDVESGLFISVNRTGGVDIDLISDLTGISSDKVEKDLLESGLIFKTPADGYETAEVYLSGNVKAKLREAEAMEHFDKDFSKNVAALQKIIPEDIPYQEISVNPGATWVPDDVYADFIAYMLGGYNNEYRRDVEVKYSSHLNEYMIEIDKRLTGNEKNKKTWGTSRRTFKDLIKSILNSRTINVNDNIDGKYVNNIEETAAARAKADEIVKEFQDWIWRDEKRRDEMSHLYNEVFNNRVNPQYDGSHFTVNGLNPKYDMRPHQKDVAHRIVMSGGNTLIAHKVGAGKTLEMAAAAMKMKQLGIIKKPMFVVPKSLVGQWGSEFLDMFPGAKILVAESNDFSPDNRKTYANRIANGNYDAVIVSYEQFEKIPVSPSFSAELYQEEINDIIAAIEAENLETGRKPLTVKDLETRKSNLEEKIKKLTSTEKDEDNVSFEDLGIDALFVDEAHNFKNLMYTTRMSNVSGLGSTEGSQKAFDMYTKVRYLQHLNGGKGVVFATATPVMNSMAEMYTMQKYLQPDVLKQLGISTFDAWAKQFGEVVEGLEIKPNGVGYRTKQSFSKFKNLRELQLLFRSFTDVLTHVPGLKIPKMKGGTPTVVECLPSPEQEAYMKELEKRAERVKGVDPHKDNMLKITSDGRKAAYSRRMFDPSLPYEEEGKIYKCADNIVKKYNESNDIKGTQLVFCDLSTPKGKDKSKEAKSDYDSEEMDAESVQLYQDLKDRLISLGIPENEIAFIHDAKTDAQRKALFDKVNEGEIRVLIGSTGKMGVGMNAQKRIVAIHHLDAPWRPGDVEQRNGRVFRQGNINDEAECFIYVTKGSFDARLWDILDRKQKFISQALEGDDLGREVEDVGEVTLSAAEVKAIASDNPLIEEQVRLENEIEKLEFIQKAFFKKMSEINRDKQKYLSKIPILQSSIAGGEKDIKTAKSTVDKDKFSITIGKTKYTDKKEAGTALFAEVLSTVSKKTDTGKYFTIGSIGGFELKAMYDTSHAEYRGLIVGEQSYPFNVYTEQTTRMITNIEGKIESIKDTVDSWKANLENVGKQIDELNKLSEKTFDKEDELKQKKERHAEIMKQLTDKEKQVMVGDSENESAQVATPTLSDREVLAMAADQIIEEDSRTDDKATHLNEAERAALDIFNRRMNVLDDLMEQRKELGVRYRELQFGMNDTKVNRAEAARVKEQMPILDSKIQRAELDVITVEEKTVLKNVLKRSRKIVEAEQKKVDKEKLTQWKAKRADTQRKNRYRNKIARDVKAMNKWFIKPDNKSAINHIPEVLKSSVIPFLLQIDFSSPRQLRGDGLTKADEQWIKQITQVKQALENVQDTYGMYSGYADLPTGFMDMVNKHIERVNDLIRSSGADEFVIYKMSSDDLKSLSEIVSTLKTYIQNFNAFHSNAMMRNVYEAGHDTYETLEKMSSAGSMTNSVSNYFGWQQIRPAYAFERFGEGGRAVYDGLRRGQAKLAFNAKQIINFAESTYTEKEVKAWEKEKRYIDLDGDHVEIPVSHIMGFYLMYNRPQGKKHILGGGFRIATYSENKVSRLEDLRKMARGVKGAIGARDLKQLAKELNPKEKFYDVGHKITEDDAEHIISLLKPREIEVADKLQHFMAEVGGEWGNYVSVARFGERLFGEPDYYPISSDGRHLPAKVEESPSNASLYALLNMSFTKALNEDADNRVILYSVFDVFANHMSDMAQYNAMALPVLDALKWFNYKEQNDDGEVIGNIRDEMDRVYGTPEEKKPGSGTKGYADAFITNILKGYNGTEAQGSPMDTIGLQLLHRYNIAQVAANWRVAALQPTAIARAALLLDKNALIEGIKMNPDAYRQNAEEMEKYSGIAAWKSLGFYDVNISRGMTQQIKHDDKIMDKVSEKGMFLAEKADRITWAAMWHASKAQISKEGKYEEGSEEYWNAVTTLFEDVIYKTQVVDSILTKTEFARDKGYFARSVSSFMSEPVTTASMVIGAYDKVLRDMKSDNTLSLRKAISKNASLIRRTTFAYCFSAVLAGIMQAISDALRDDDDYKTFIEKLSDSTLENMISELNPASKVPIMSDIIDTVKAIAGAFGADTYGYLNNTVSGQLAGYLVKVGEILSDKRTNYTSYGVIYNLLKFVSGMSSVPISSATREVVMVWNNTVGFVNKDLKIKSYAPTRKNQIKYSYMDGYLTEREAINELMAEGVYSDPDDAYWAVQSWGGGEDYTKYQAVFDSMLQGKEIRKSDIDELTSHGVTRDQIKSAMKSEIKEQYQNRKISKTEANNMLIKYCGVDGKNAAIVITNKWTAKIATGYEYSEIEEALETGKITKAQAKQMYIKYGGLTEKEASMKMQIYDWQAAGYDIGGNQGYIIEEYKNYGEPFDISKQTFINVKNYYSHAEGNGKPYSKVKTTIAYIDGLNLSVTQKKALAYSFWSEKTVRKYMPSSWR